MRVSKAQSLSVVVDDAGAARFERLAQAPRVPVAAVFLDEEDDAGAGSG